MLYISPLEWVLVYTCFSNLCYIYINYVRFLSMVVIGFSCTNFCTPVHLTLHFLPCLYIYTYWSMIDFLRILSIPLDCCQSANAGQKTDRQTYQHTDRQTDRQTGRKTDRQTDKQREIDRWMDGQTGACVFVCSCITAMISCFIVW